MAHPEITEAYIRDNSIVNQYIRSYDEFVSTTIGKIIEAKSLIEPQVEGLQLKLGGLRIEKPYVVEADGSKRILYPLEAKIRDLSYTASLYLEITIVINGVEQKREEVSVGELPVMVKSSLCHLKNKSREELIQLGEDPNDPGGYFIINGTEKALVTLEDLAPNRVIVDVNEAKGDVEAKVFSTHAGFRAKCAVIRHKDGRMYATMPSSSKPIELILLLHALGLSKDEEILKAFSDEKVVKNDVLLNLENKTSKNTREALRIIGKRIAPGQPEQYQLKRAEILLDNYLLPHIGVSKEDRLSKAYYLCRSAERAIRVAYKKRKPDDKDHYANKRLKLPNKLMGELFRYAFQFLSKDIAYQIERANVRGRKTSHMNVIVRPDALTDRIKYSMATGNWVGGHTGVCQPLDRHNFISSIAFMRRITSPLARKHPHYKARDLNGTHFGRLDPNETPEGPNCGLIKNMALFTEITIGTSEKPVEKYLKRKKIEMKANNCAVYLNGRLVGFVADGAMLASNVRNARRRGELSEQINVFFDPKVNEININSDEGRIRRPLIVVRDGKSTYTPEIKKQVKNKKLKWKDLVNKGIIEYLDAEEEENAYVALDEKELTLEHTHLEIDPVGILGYVSNQLVFPEHNMAPRVLMSAQHTKQSIGLFAANFNLRTDTRANLLHYPQKPLVTSRIYNLTEGYRRASGENFVVAVLSGEGYNMNDAIILNRGAVQRGLARSEFYRTYTAEEQRYPGGQKDKFEIPQEYVNGYLGEEAYKHLSEDGIAIPETPVGPDTVLIGRTSPPRFLKEVSALDIETEKRRDSSVRMRANEKGIVDGVILTETTAGNKLIKVRVREPMAPEIGDKFASRHGQKGVISLLLPQEDMPFTRDGITPDLLINPHAMPGRMTAGHLIEMLAGKSAALDGKEKDGTPFTGEKAEDFEKILREHGFREKGIETLYNPRTGKPLIAKIFVGIIYYQRLHHLVALKMHARSRGPVQMLTHQPTEGRAREGGLRLGEMERDCFIGFGAAAILKERMMDSSDKTTVLVCNKCGSLAVYDKNKHRKYCPVCKSEDVEEVEMSYAFKLLLNEIESLGIFPKLIIGERE